MFHEMGEQGLQASRAPNTVLRWRTTRTVWTPAVCLVVLLGVSCGGQISDEAGRVRGKSELLLLDQLGQPVAQTRALIDGKVVMTDDEGRAQLGELPASYDAVIADGTYVRAFMGLKARSPTIELANRNLHFNNEYVANVNISKVNTGANQGLFYAAGVTGEGIARQELGYNSDDKWSWATLSWAGAPEVTLSAQAFLAQLDPETRYVVGYSGFASKSWSNAARQQTVSWTPEFDIPTFKTKTILGRSRANRIICVECERGLARAGSTWSDLRYLRSDLRPRRLLPNRHARRFGGRHHLRGRGRWGTATGTGERAGERDPQDRL